MRMFIIVFYFPKLSRLVIGHAYYVESVKKNKLFELNPREILCSTRSIREQEFAKIIGIYFEIKSSVRICCLQVN